MNFRGGVGVLGVAVEGRSTIFFTVTLCVRVKINKRPFEPFVFGSCIIHHHCPLVRNRHPSRISVLSYFCSAIVSLLYSCLAALLPLLSSFFPLCYRPLVLAVIVRLPALLSSPCPSSYRPPARSVIVPLS